MNILKPDYKKYYGTYKKLPGILAILICVLTLIWSIVDLAVFSHESRYGNIYYGIMELKSLVLTLLIWWAIGAVLAVGTWFFSTLAVSATVARTDAIIEINDKIKKTNESQN